MKDICLSVVLPVYSEKESVIEIVDWLRNNVKEYLHEVIIILAPKSDDECRKSCKDLEQKGHVRVSVQKRNPGLGLAFRQGLEEATGTHVLMLDSDGEMGLGSISKMIQKFEKTDCDVVVGSRWMKGGSVVGYDPLKYWYNRLFQQFFRILFWTKVHDLTIGYKMMKNEVAKNITWGGKFHDIGTETTLKPIKYRYNVVEVPTLWKKRTRGKSKNNWINNSRYVMMALKIFFSIN
ncbi:glycosyltransferase family 2 protein [Candidatus Altiarchaeota archaeon]